MLFIQNHDLPYPDYSYIALRNCILNRWSIWQKHILYYELIGCTVSINDIWV